MEQNQRIREYAIKRAEQCIQDWAHEGWYELNELWGTNFTEDELQEICELAYNSKVILMK